MEFSRAALVIAHPGHELRVHGWVSQYLPRTYVITDGSGHSGVSRLGSTQTVLCDLGSEPGEVFGRFSDREIYDAIREHDSALFQGLVDSLAHSFILHDVRTVAGDAIEWFNPTHDICRMLINAAVDVVRLSSGRQIANYEFCLTEWEQGCEENHDDRCWHLHLEHDRLDHKLEAACNYVELKDEVEQALANRGKDYFRLECLKRVPVAAPIVVPLTKPHYEICGEKRVIDGTYHSVIRYEQHIAPLQRALCDYVEIAASHFSPRHAIA
jgi:hypothetical protein